MSFVREPNAEPVPGYRLIGPLGSGGFGEVWKCEAPGGIFKAIKFVYGNLKALDAESARAEQELKALNCVKEVRHPFVLSLDRIEVVDGELVIVMELADKNLHELFEECQAAGMVGIPRNDLLRYLRDAAEALDHMYQKHKLQHLDIKPRNLFLISDRVKVADFGLVKPVERESGEFSSVTPLYAPPETFTGKISEFSDQYSLAIVYQEMLTGQRPFTGKNARQLMMQHTQQEPELRNLPEADRPVVARALSKDPAKRFPNCLAFVRALYTARAKPETLLETPSVEKAGRPSRSLAETMEDMLLDQMAELDLAEQPAETEEEAVSQLGLTIHQPQTGSLRPTLIIGVGGFSRRALLELRCRLLDRFGDLSKIPIFHFLYIDSDGEAVKTAARGAEEVACTAEELYHMPLQPIGAYRRRMLEHLNEWLPQEKLFSLPRSLQTQGIRALGRLAFVDHHQRLLAKVRREIQRITHPDTLYRAVEQTGLALRDSRPRVYIIASAGGGSSGLLPDLGYGLRRLLQQLRYADSEVTALLFCGATEDPATPRTELANIYATLTELSHFNDPGVPFTAQYGVDLPRYVDNGSPFHQVYLLKLAHRSPESVRDAVAHLGSYLFHELTTPLGIRLKNIRECKTNTDATPFRSFGTYAVWFPRGLLLRMAARQACLHLLQDWQATGEATAQDEVEAACASALADPELRFEVLCARLESSAAGAFDGNLSGALTALLASLDEQSQQSVAQDDLGNWVRQALWRVHEWVGSAGSWGDSDFQKSRLSRAMNLAIQKLAEQWDQRLTEIAISLMEHPGGRVASAEAALEKFIQFCKDSAATHRPRLEQQSQRTKTAGEHLDKALDACIAGQGGFSFFGSRSRRLLRVFMDHLAAYGRQSLSEGLVTAGVHFYGTLQRRLEDRLREMSFCRQRLRNMQETLETAVPVEETAPVTRFETEMTPIHSPLPSTEAYWDAIRDSETARVVLPEGETDMEQAALRFLESLTAEQWTQLDQTLQDQVLGAMGGLHKICTTSSDLSRSLATPLLIQLAVSLGNLLPTTDVAEAEFSAAEAEKEGLATRIQAYFASALPLVIGKDSSNQYAYLLVPASDRGKEFGEEAKQTIRSLELVRVSGQADLMFCREQGNLNIEDLRPMLASCRQVYDETILTPSTSPHARFDITDWVPLDP